MRKIPPETSSGSYSRMRARSNFPRLALVALVSGALLAGCTRQEGDAIVIEKEHIAAGAPTPSPPTQTLADQLPEVKERDMAPDEIAVDGLVMKAKDRGSSRDPRAMKDEQWLVKVRLFDGGRIFNVPTDRPRFEKLSSGDNVHVRYQVGKYTGTVWGAELLEP